MTNIPTTDLPELSPESIDRMEAAVFSQIARERAATDSIPDAPRSRRARYRWLTAAGIAAAFATGVMVTPVILNAIGPTAVSDSSVSSAPDWSVAARDSGGGEIAPVMPPDSITEQRAADGDIAATDSLTGRDIVASGHASVRVEEIAAASDQIAEIAASLGGYVESTNIGETMHRSDISVPVPPGGDYGWVTLRVPAESLSDAIAALSDVGEVRSSSVSKQDVTMHAIDLRARVETTRASVERLTQLMEQSVSVTELIEAEVALAERHAQLESYEQQLAALDNQVAMSSLHVDLTRITPVTPADPAGFTDGLKAGWNGLIVSLNALVIAAGFVLPWLAVLGIVALVVWGILRARRGRRNRPESSDQRP